MSYLDENWHDLPWSRWHEPQDLGKGKENYLGVPHQPGVYRIRMGDLPAYFGESSDLAQRLVDDWNDVNRTSPPAASHRENAFRYLVEVRRKIGMEYEMSWTIEPGPWPYVLNDKRHRECLERCLGWLSRLETVRRPIANYARAGNGSQLVSDVTSKGHPKQVHPSGTTHRGTRALRPDEHGPTSTRWMNLPWAKLATRKNLSPRQAPGLPGLSGAGLGPGLYKTVSAEGNLLFLGYSRHALVSLRRILQTLNRREEKPAGAWHPLPRKVLKLEARELLDDLIGAYYHKSGQMPKYQFKGVICS